MSTFRLPRVGRREEAEEEVGDEVDWADVDWTLGEARRAAVAATDRTRASFRIAAAERH